MRSRQPGSKRPPMRDGVTASCVYLPALPAWSAPTPPLGWPSIYRFLVAHFPHISEAIWLERIRQQRVIDESGQPIQCDTPYRENSKIYYYREVAQEKPIPFEHRILFANAHLLVVDKPHFLPVSPVGQYVQHSVLVRLKQQLDNPDITPIHRLDRETAGVMLFSLQPASRALYQQLFAARQVHKIYHAIAKARPELAYPLHYQSRLVKGSPFFTMQQVQGTANSFTRIELLRQRHELALYQLQPLSGKQHQLRVHMAALQMPIVNDRLYPVVQNLQHDDYARPLQLLAASIGFVDPVTRQAVCYHSQQSLDFAQAMAPD